MSLTPPLGPTNGGGDETQHTAYFSIEGEEDLQEQINEYWNCIKEETKARGYSGLIGAQSLTKKQTLSDDIMFPQKDGMVIGNANTFLFKQRFQLGFLLAGKDYISPDDLDGIKYLENDEFVQDESEKAKEDFPLAKPGQSQMIVEHRGNIILLYDKIQRGTMLHGLYKKRRKKTQKKKKENLTDGERSSTPDQPKKTITITSGQVKALSRLIDNLKEVYKSLAKRYLKLLNEVQSLQDTRNKLVGNSEIGSSEKGKNICQNDLLDVLIEINLTHENAEDSDQGDAHMLMKYQREMLQKVEKIDNQIIKIEKEINQTKLKIWRVEQELRSVGYLYEIVSHHVSQDVQKKEWEIPIIKTE